MNFKNYFYSTFDNDIRLIETGLKPYIYEYYDDFDDDGYGVCSLDELFEDSTSSTKESIKHIVQCYKHDNLIGVTVDNKEVIPPCYEKIRIIPLKAYKKPYFYAVVRLETNGEKKYGIISDTNEIILPVIYDDISWWSKWDFLKDYCFAIKIRQQDKYFCFDVTNKAPLFEIDNYDYISEFYSFDWVSKEFRDYIDQIGWGNKKYSIVKKGKCYGAIFNDGTIIANPLFRMIKGFEVSIQNNKPELRTDIVFEDGVNGWMNCHGLVWGVFPNNIYRSIKPLKDNRFIALNNGGCYGLIDNKGNIVCDFIYNDYFKQQPNRAGYYFSKDYILFHDSNGWTIVNADTGKRSSSYYKQIDWHPSCEYCYVSNEDNKRGIIKVTGESLIDCIYDKINRFIPKEGSFALDAVLNGIEGSILNGSFVLKKDNDILINHYSHLFPQFSRHANPHTGSHEFYEEKHYSEFSGTYAQDEAGYSDEEIWDIFDGEPDAYWNIDLKYQQTTIND